MRRQHLDDALGVGAVPVHPYAERLDAAQHQPASRTARRSSPSRSGCRRAARRARCRRPPARRRPRRSAHPCTSSSSARRRPRRGPAAAAGTARRTCCRRPAARRRHGPAAAIAAMSTIPSSGLVGVSTQITLVRPGRIAARNASTSWPPGGREVQTPALLHLREQPVGAAVGIAGDHDVVAGPAEGAEQRVLGGQPGGEGQPAAAALQRGEALLQRGAGRVAAAAVLVAAAQPADAVLLVGRGLVDRRHDRTGRGVRLLAGMDRERLELHGPDSTAARPRRTRRSTPASPPPESPARTPRPRPPSSRSPPCAPPRRPGSWRPPPGPTPSAAAGWRC